MSTVEVFVDTNVFLRLFTSDNAQMTADCERLIRRAEGGEVVLHTTHLVLAEIEWTLTSVYDLPREEVGSILADILRLESLRIDHKQLLTQAVEIYRSTRVDLADAIHALDARRRGIERICSYDRDFDRLGVTRVEPAAV